MEANAHRSNSNINNLYIHSQCLFIIINIIIIKSNYAAIIQWRQLQSNYDKLIKNIQKEFDFSVCVWVSECEKSDDETRERYHVELNEQQQQPQDVNKPKELWGLDAAEHGLSDDARQRANREAWRNTPKILGIRVGRWIAAPNGRPSQDKRPLYRLDQTDVDLQEHARGYGR